MKVWMDVMRDLEHVMDDHERCLDTWQAGGVDGIVLGPMFFNAAKLLPGLKRPKGAPPSEAAFDPNPRIYEKLGVPVPPTPAAMPERRDLLGKMLTRAKDRGMTLMIFQPMMGMTPKDPGHSLADPAQRDNAIARMVDTFEQFPMVDGGVMDRPEWHYEMEPGRRMHPTFFDDLEEEIEPLCRRLGYDHAALVAAKDRLEHRLHHLDPRRVRMHESGGVFDGMSLLGNDPDLTAWFRFRIESVTDYFRQVREGLAAELERPIKLGVGPRSAAFALLSGYDFEALGQFLEVLLPKHYFWQRGFDGLIGTVHRYVQTLCTWNSDLTESDAILVVQNLFGLRLPGVENLVDMECALTPDFYQEIVTRETRRALAAVDDPERIVPWVDVGRFPHDGDPMSPSDLRQLIEAAESMGLKRFLYHHHGNMTAGEWTMISEMCGQRWRPEPGGYRPPDRYEL